MALIGRIRSNVGLLVLLIALAIISFLLMDVFSGPGSQSADSINAGTVNGIPIDYQAYQTRVQNAINNQQRSNPNMTDAQRLQITENAWDGYVKEVLADQEYDKLGITVPKEEVSSLFLGANAHPSLRNERTFQNPETGQFDPDMVRQYEDNLSNPPENADSRQISSSIRQWNEFKKFVKKDQKRIKYENLIKKAIYVPTWMAEQSNAATNRKSDISYVQIPYTSINDNEVSITDNDLRTHLNNNLNTYKQKANCDIEFVTFDIVPSEADKQEVLTQINNRLTDFKSAPDDSAFIRSYSDIPFNSQYLTQQQIPITQKQDVMNAQVGEVYGPIQDGDRYIAYKVLDRISIADSVSCGHILKRVAPNTDDAVARKAIDSLYNLAIGGADFEELAINNSEDQSNAENGGDLGWVQPGRMVKPFNDAIFYKGRQGDVLKVKTSFGWHLVKIHQSTPSSQAVKVAFLGKDVLPSTQTSNGIYATANEFAGRNTTLAAFRSAAQEKGFNVQTATNLEQNAYNVPNLGATNEVPSWAYSKNVGDVSNVFILDDKYVVAAVTKKRQAGTPTVDDVRLRLESEVRNTKKAALIAEKLGGNTDLNSIASNYSQTVQNATGVAFDGLNSTLGREPKVQAVAASLEANQSSGPIQGEQGVYVVKVNSVNNPTAGDMTAVKNTQATALRSRVSGTVMEAIKNVSQVEDIRYKFRTR